MYQANSLLTTKNAAGGPLGSPNSCVSPANRIEPRQETGGALLLPPLPAASPIPTIGGGYPSFLYCTGLKMDSTGREMSGPRAEDDGMASLICPSRLNSQHLPQGGLESPTRRPDPDNAAGFSDRVLARPSNGMVDSPPQHGTVGRNRGRSLGLSGNATGPGFDTPQVQSPVAGRRAHCHPALPRQPAFLPIRREGARPARSWLRVSVWNFPVLYRPVQVDQRDLVIALSGSRRVLVRVQAGPCFRWEADQPTDRPIGLQTLFGARVHPFKAARLFSLGIFPTASI